MEKEFNEFGGQPKVTKADVINALKRLEKLALTQPI